MSTPASDEPLQQAGVVPFRWHQGELQFCLITTLKGHWGFPKGIIDPGETPTETAAKEASEEAGIAGTIAPLPLGRYGDRKWGRQLEIEMYLMEVDTAADDWLEASHRQRRWVDASTARTLIERPDVATMLRLACERIDASSK